MRALGGEDGRVSSRSRGRSRGRGRAKSTLDGQGYQHHILSVHEIDGTVTSPTQSMSGVNFSSSHSQSRGRGGWSGGRSKGRVKPSTSYAAGELCCNKYVNII